MESSKPGENVSLDKEITSPHSEALPVRSVQRNLLHNPNTSKQAVKAALRTHAFQLVRMQNEIQSLKSQLRKAIEEKEAQSSDMKTLYLHMAELKGLVARLTMEADMPNTTKRELPLETKSEEHTRRAKQVLNHVERFADAFLQQQRMSLISCLNNLQIATADETTSMRSFGAPAAADLTHTPRQTGALLDARAKEFVIRSERTTPDPLINIKQEDEAEGSI